MPEEFPQEFPNRRKGPIISPPSKRIRDSNSIANNENKQQIVTPPLIDLLQAAFQRKLHRLQQQIFQDEQQDQQDQKEGQEQKERQHGEENEPKHKRKHIEFIEPELHFQHIVEGKNGDNNEDCSGSDYNEADPFDLSLFNPEELDRIEFQLPNDEDEEEEEEEEEEVPFSNLESDWQLRGN